MNFEPTEQVTLFKFSDSVQLNHTNTLQALFNFFVSFQYKNK